MKGKKVSSDAEIGAAVFAARTASEVDEALAAVAFRRESSGGRGECPEYLIPGAGEVDEVFRDASRVGSPGWWDMVHALNERHAACVAAVGADWHPHVGAMRQAIAEAVGEIVPGEDGLRFLTPEQVAVDGALRVEWEQRLWLMALERNPAGALPHPREPVVAWWQAHQAKRFRPRVRGSLPRFDKTALEEARLLAHQDSAVVDAPGQLSILRGDDVVDYCPAWLLDMFLRARSVRTDRALGSTRGGMPWSFTMAIGGLAHYAIADRLRWASHGRNLSFGIDEVIGWLHPEGWANRARDWGRLDAAFEECASYRVTVGEHRFSVVSAFGLPAVYSSAASVILNVTVPPSAAYGVRFDWKAYVGYAKRAALQRALLATAGLLDRTAHHGNPLTRFVREPELDADGQPKREKVKGADGKPKRGANGQYETRPVYTGKLVPNPLLARVQPAILPAKSVAHFLGMADKGKNRHDAREALATLHADGVIDLEAVPTGYRVYGPSPKALPEDG